jgi:hypothetical protein
MHVKHMHALIALHCIALHCMLSATNAKESISISQPTCILVAREQVEGSPTSARIHNGTHFGYKTHKTHYIILFFIADPT